jgi:trk system potassium uptake protein
VAAVAFFLLTPVGGCTGSTAGGAKAMRWIIFGRLAIERIRALYNPHGVFVTRFDGRPVSDDVLAGVMSFFFFYVATMAAVALALGLSGLDMATAVSGAMTAVANVGPGVGSIIGPSGNFASLTSFDKIVLTFGMFAGRLEMLTLFVIFTPAFWREF